MSIPPKIGVVLNQVRIAITATNLVYRPPRVANSSGLGAQPNFAENRRRAGEILALERHGLTVNETTFLISEDIIHEVTAEQIVSAMTSDQRSSGDCVLVRDSTVGCRAATALEYGDLVTRIIEERGR